MSNLVPIARAAEVLGVSTQTLRRWDAEGRIVPVRTSTGHRRYDLNSLRPDLVRPGQGSRKTVAYARVSAQDQRPDLERQGKVLEAYCAANGWEFELVSDLGSGMNYRKRGLKRLIDDIVAGKVGRLVLTHKDRLLRFGAELVFSICEIKGVEVVILNKGEDTTFEQDLANDVLEIITVFSARLYGSRSNKNKRLLADLAKAAQPSLSQVIDAAMAEELA